MTILRIACSALLVGLAAWTVPAGVLAEGGDEATTKLFRSQCASCHGVDGKGQTTPGKKLGTKNWSDGKTLQALSDPQMQKIIREGVKGSDGKFKMKPFSKLSDEQVTALTKYVRALGQGK